ncbi:hypothetical protein ElyMa_003965400 [Elysia marginata]|uniref:BTB domain-containing protein n=1 Tax=Elysia marginata TaxID=1093978 RepID=A0AAV4FVS3_9GAST|nr:hypothetical protein ElyMa_003965400 [Elysia marginata]
MADQPKKAVSLRLGSCRTLVCKPKEHRDNAIRAMKAHDALEAVPGNSADEIFVKVSRIEDFTGVLDTDEYRLSEAKHSNVLFNMFTMAPPKVMTDMQLTPTEQEFDYVVHYMYKMFGKKQPRAPMSTDTYVLVTYDILRNVGLVNVRSFPKAVLMDLRRPAKLMYDEFLFTKPMFDSRPIMNPLNYVPTERVVLILKAKHLHDLLMRCVMDEIALIKVTLMCRFVNLWLARSNEYL